MTKVTMPDPVAYSVTNKIYPEASAALHHDPSFAMGDDDLHIEGLITTTQAEAYKDACVREALELAADTCAGIAIPTSHDAPNKQVALECALAIRALIPSTPA